MRRNSRVELHLAPAVHFVIVVVSYFTSSSSSSSNSGRIAGNVLPCTIRSSVFDIPLVIVVDRRSGGGVGVTKAEQQLRWLDI